MELGKPLWICGFGARAAHPAGSISSEPCMSPTSSIFFSWTKELLVSCLRPKWLIPNPVAFPYICAQV